MNKTLLLSITTLVLGVFNNAKSQSIPNAGFETWTNMGTYEDPQSWSTTNQYSTANGPVSVIKSTDAHSGSYAIKIITYTDGTFPVTLSGGASTAPDILDTTGGFPYTGMPKTFSCYGKYKQQGADTGMVLCQLTKWDNVSKTRKHIAQAMLMFTSNVNTYSYTSDDFVYDLNEAPDTAYIVLIPTLSYMPAAGCELTVDDLAFEGTVGIKEINAESTVSVFPNPFKDQCTIHIPSSLLASGLNLRLLDITGREVKVITHIEQSHLVITKDNLPAGIYLYQLTNSSGIVNTGKLSIQ